MPPQEDTEPSTSFITNPFIHVIRFDSVLSQESHDSAREPAL